MTVLQSSESVRAALDETRGSGAASADLARRQTQMTALAQASDSIGVRTRNLIAAARGMVTAAARRPPRC